MANIARLEKQFQVEEAPGLRIRALLPNHEQ